MFYAILDNLCKNKGTTVTAVLKELNISTSKGTAWKNGSVPNAEIVLMLSQHLHVSMEYLMGASEADRSGEIPYVSPKALEILSKLAQLSDEQILDVKNYIEFRDYQSKR